jgi:hypothetical protein
MGDNAADPIDHHRTTRAHAGQNMKNTAAMPGLVFVAFGVLAFVLALAALAGRDYVTKHPEAQPAPPDG